jgi:hypothetical protein
MPLQQTSGNVTQDAYGGGAASLPVYVENVFSTYVYTGNGTGSLSVPNGIDLLDNGGLVWTKERNNTGNHFLEDSARGWGYDLHTNNTASQDYGAGITPLTNGFTNTYGFGSSDNLVSWTFRKQPNFFDIVTYTGTGSVQNIAHNLGSTPGCIIVKATSTTGNWTVYHNGLHGGVTPEQYYINLNLSNAQSLNSGPWNNTAPTSTQFTVGVGGPCNVSGVTYIAYLFGAGGTGGFGLTGTQDIISCGSFTTTGSLQSISLGWEPQWVLMKRTDSTGSWWLFDTMRGMSNTDTLFLYPNQSNAEYDNGSPVCVPTATGFNLPSGVFGASQSWIYIAIRRGPMAVPTTGTSVFAPVVQSVTSTPAQVTTGFVTDFVSSNYISGGNPNTFIDRLRGSSQSNSVYLQTSNTNAEITQTYGFGFDNETGYIDNFWYTNFGAGSYVYWNFARAPKFFDIVCYKGTGSATTQAHNLTVAPEMMIVKSRTNGAASWYIYHKGLNGGTTPENYHLDFTSSPISTSSSAWWNSTAPTSSVFSIGAANAVSQSGATFAAYLFATLTGVSYVGSYTGNGTGQSIACGFGAGGARFILIKRTDSTGNWYCFDSANGLTSSSSPYLLWNSGAPQTTGNNGVYASSGGFTLTSNASSTVNVNSGTFIFLAIA